MFKFSVRSLLAAAVLILASFPADAGECCRERPVRAFFSNVAERLRSRGERLVRFSCEVAASVRPSVNLTFVNGNPTVGFSYQFAGRSSCEGGKCQHAN